MALDPYELFHGNVYMIQLQIHQKLFLISIFPKSFAYFWSFETNDHHGNITLLNKYFIYHGRTHKVLQYWDGSNTFEFLFP